MFTFYHQNCLISFCENSLKYARRGRDFRTEGKKLIQSYWDNCTSGIESDFIFALGRKRIIQAAFEGYVYKEDYISAYKVLWYSTGKERITILRYVYKALYTPFLYEQALAEFMNSPTLETVVKVSIPLIKAANFRFLQDSECCKDSWVREGDCLERIQKVYMSRLHDLTVMSLGLCLEEIQKLHHRQIDFFCREEIRKVAEKSKKMQLPSPCWIGWSGVVALHHGKPPMYHQFLHKRIRNRYADKILEAIREEDNVENTADFL
jgi:hypothetical protein